MRILLVQRSLRPPGGGNAVAAWMLHALATDHQVATLTLDDWTPAATNAFYGTAIPDGIERHVVPWPWLGRVPDNRAYRLRMAVLLRQARTLASGYDLMMTADDYAVFAKPGIQYVHFPATLTPVPARMAMIVALYFRVCDWWIGLPWSRARENLTLANSQWTAGRLLDVARVRVVYPPVVETGPGLPWAERADTVLCIGRFHASKRIGTVIAIVRRLRAHALPGARLLIVGSAVDSGYYRRLRQAVSRDRHWIEFREDLSRDELNALMGRSRYGIHAMEGEHFGMATAEMVRAGCLVFPHGSGGSVEVVDGARELLWRTEDEAVARVSAITRDAALRDQLRARLKTHARQFSTDRFVDRIRAIVGDCTVR